MPLPYIKYFIRFPLDKNKIQVPNSDSHSSLQSGHFLPLQPHPAVFPTPSRCHGQLLSFLCPEPTSSFSFCRQFTPCSLYSWYLLHPQATSFSQRPSLSTLPNEASKIVPSRWTHFVIFITSLTISNYST